jgi:aryl-alcohol dehydrogenase-like predicted oxidoreductase
MQQRPFGDLDAASALSLGGGGLGQLWGATTREECVATVLEAANLGINVLDVAPSYGDGEAERVIGAAFGGTLPTGMRITTKCRIGNTPPADVYRVLSDSLSASLERMCLERVDIMFLHDWVTLNGNSSDRITTTRVVTEAIAPAFERLVAQGRIGYWGLTGIGEPDAIIDLLSYGPRADYVQCITNLLDSAGSLQRSEGPTRAADIIAAADSHGVGVMGIRAVQAGALTDGIDRNLPESHSERRDYDRATGYRVLAKETGQSPAFLAHQYALSIPGVSTLVLGVKNREELAECVAAEAAGPMDPSLMERIRQSVGRI